MVGKCYYGDKCRYDHVRLKDTYQSESKKRYIKLRGHVTGVFILCGHVTGVFILHGVFSLPLPV